MPYSTIRQSNSRTPSVFVALAFCNTTIVLCSRVCTRPLPYTPGGLTRPRTPQHTDVLKFDLEVEDLAAELHEDATEPKMDFLSQIAWLPCRRGFVIARVVHANSCGHRWKELPPGVDGKPSGAGPKQE